MPGTMLDHNPASHEWYDHPDAPKFVETHPDEYRTSGHWLFLPGSFSSFHKVLNNEELWLIHAGRLRVHILEPAGRHSVLHFGLDLAAGELLPTLSFKAVGLPGTCMGEHRA